MAFANLTNLEELPEETVLEYNKRIIDEVKTRIMGDSNSETVIAFLNIINDFYYGNNECCVAIMEKDRKQNPEDVYIPELFTYVLSCSFEFNILFREYEKFKELYEKADKLLEEDKENGVEMLDVLMKYLNEKYPNREETAILRSKIEFALFSGIISFGLNCFRNANGEGFTIDGKVTPDKLAIAKFLNPLFLYPSYRYNNSR